MPTQKAQPAPIVPTRQNIRGMKVILHGEVPGKSKAQVIAELEALGATVSTKRLKNADCVLVGKEPKFSKALEREFLWKDNRIKSYGPKTLFALVPPAKPNARAQPKAKSKK